MSQPIPSSPQKRRIRWVWALIIAVFMTPLVLVVVLAGLYVVARQQQQEALVKVQASQIALLQARQFEEAARAAAVNSPVATPVVPSSHSMQVQVVKIQLDFEDFDGFTTRTVDAVTVASEETLSLLTVPSEVFTPMPMKINGRIVTRKARNLRVIEEVGVPGMGAASMAPGAMYGSVSIFGEYPSIGLTQLLLPNLRLKPVRVLGDFPKVAVGDNLKVVSATHYDPAPVLKVLGTDETAHNANGERFEHLLKLSGWIGPVGPMVCNETGDPIGQILFTIPGNPASTYPGNTTHTYAIPMDRIFATIQSGTHPSDVPGTPHPPGPAESRGEFRSLTIDASNPNPNANETTGRDIPPAAGLSGPLIATTIGDDPQPLTPSPPVGNPILPTDASQAATSTTPGEMRIYRVQGFAPDVADAIRSLYGTEAKVAVDRGGRAVIAIASPAVQEKISTTIEEMNRGAQEVMAEQAKKAELEKKQQADLTAEQRLELDKLQKEAADRDAADEESHRKNPQRTRIVKVDGRDPREVSKILSNLFGQKADIAIDERTGSILITVNRATTWAEVQFLLSEIEATAKRLAMETPAAMTTPIQTELAPSNPLTKQSTGGDVRSREQVIADQDREAKSLALQLRTAAPAEQDAVRKKLEQQIERQFRERQSLRKQEIDDLSSRIEKLRAGQMRREENRTEIIRRRINELLDPQSDLRWDESQNSTRTTTSVSEQRVVNETAPDATPPATTESTFDGVPYSQWRKMLETERKPAKLTTAMEACSRLASPVDARQVARAIIKAASFETDTSDERQEVWKAALNGLERMPPDAVIDEVLASLNMTGSTGGGRNLQGIFFAETERSATMSKALNARDQEIVAALIKAISQGKEDREWLLAGACKLWENSSRELKDFDGLEPLVLQRIDTPPPVSNYYFGDNWMIVAEALVKKNPETPGLAVKFMNYSQQQRAFPDMTRLVGSLRHHAEPAVPMIVDQFLGEWRKIEAENRTNRNAGRRRSQFGNLGQSVPERLIELLGEIGVGAKGASLLKELNLISAANSGDDLLVSKIYFESKKAIGRFSEVPNEDSPCLLGDESLIHGVWQLKSSNSDAALKCEASIENDLMSWTWHESGKQLVQRSRVSLDTTKTPKEIMLNAVPGLGSGPLRNGIYELTETTFTIYLAPPDNAAPTEMLKDLTAIPEGYTLLEMRRSLATPGTAESPE